jgi:hypothetical protein
VDIAEVKRMTQSDHPLRRGDLIFFSGLRRSPGIQYAQRTINGFLISAFYEQSCNCLTGCASDPTIPCHNAQRTMKHGGGLRTTKQWR